MSISTIFEWALALFGAFYFSWLALGTTVMRFYLPRGVVVCDAYDQAARDRIIVGTFVTTIVLFAIIALCIVYVHASL